MADTQYEERPTLDKDLDRLGIIESGVRFVLLRSATSGLALIFIVAAGMVATTVASSNPAMMIVIAAAALGAYMAMNIGANDVTNNVGAAVGAKALSMTSALIIAAIFEIAGAFLAGDKVVGTIKSAIVNPALVPDSNHMLIIMVSALLSASLWINFATWINAPISTTHSIIGSIMGAGIAIAGRQVVDWRSLAEISLGWIISPVLGALIAVALLWFITEKIVYNADKIAAARRWVPVLLAIMTGSFLSYILLLGMRDNPDLKLWHIVTIGVLVGGLSYFFFKNSVAVVSQGLGNRNSSLKVLFRIPLIFSAALLSFAHGANDVSNAIGPLSAVVEAIGVRTIATNLDAPIWVMSIGALGISVGVLLFGPRLIRIVGSQITRLNPIRAFCVAMSAAVTVIIASALGLPVSSTHIAVGSVFGIGLFREWFNARSERRRQYLEMRAALEAGSDPVTIKGTKQLTHEKSYRYLVRRSHLLTILAAWVVTVPVAGLLGALVATALNQFHF